MVRKGKRGTAPGKEILNRKKAFLYALSIGAAGGAAYLTWDYIKRRRSLKEQTSSDINYPAIVDNQITTVKPSIINVPSIGQRDGFPLKNGSSGTRVAQLQQALASIIGSDAMNAQGGIDGKFGSGTANALKMAGYGTTVDEATFNKIIGNTSLTVAFNPKEIATALYKASQAKNIESVLTALSRIRSVDEYSQVNTYYKEIPIISKTIVTDLLDFAFKSDEQAKQRIRNEFLRIGLKMDTSGRWSLNGFPLYKDIITLRDTFVTDSQYNRIPVRKNTVLGEEVVTSNGMTWFKAVDNSVLQVPTQDIKYT